MYFKLHTEIMHHTTPLSAWIMVSPLAMINTADMTVYEIWSTVVNVCWSVAG